MLLGEIFHHPYTEGELVRAMSQLVFSIWFLGFCFVAGCAILGGCAIYCCKMTKQRQRESPNRGVGNP